MSLLRILIRGVAVVSILTLLGFRLHTLQQKFRDQKAAFFVDKLKQGRHRITYELRAEVPGVFHGMPNQTHAMYVPEIKANGHVYHIMRASDLIGKAVGDVKIR